MADMDRLAAVREDRAEAGRTLAAAPRGTCQSWAGAAEWALDSGEPVTPMKAIDPRDFTASRAWGALDIADLDGTTVRLHWTDRPYRWHVNDGQEVFVVLDGAVDMHYRDGADERVLRLKTGDIFHAEAGDAHVAHPVGVARVLVIEKAGSV